VEIVGGEADGDTFFVCDYQINAEAFDGITTQPQMGKDGIKRVYANVTFLGVDPKTGNPKGVTVAMRVEMLPALAKGMRTLFAGVPIAFREVSSDSGPSPEEITGTVAEG
jgi:hypothetical protein